MQSRNGRIAVLVASVAVALAAFLVLKPGDDEEPATTAATPTAVATATATAPAEPTETATEAPTPEPTPEPEVIEVKDGKVVGGAADLEVSEGDLVEFAVQSDVADEIHVHGYDVKKNVEAGGTAELSFKADITGVFEIELEGAGLELARLKVSP